MQSFMGKLKALTQEKPVLTAHTNLSLRINLDEAFQQEWQVDEITSCNADGASNAGLTPAGLEKSSSVLAYIAALLGNTGCVVLVHFAPGRGNCQFGSDSSLQNGRRVKK